MRHVLLAILTFSFTHVLLAQKFTGVVRGTVHDSTTALADATVSIIKAADSSLATFTLTGKNGSFEIKNLDTTAYLLVVSYEGFQTLRKPFVLTSRSPAIDFGTLQVTPVYKTLAEVIVKEAPPVRVKGDTLAFNAGAFKVKPNALAEDLLKKLPGMQVARDGTVTTQGETVEKVYVDGKEFFGNDPKLATRNITADMIEEVQVYDERSEQSKFNKIDDGSRTKAVNLKLKQDKKRGTFGQASAGYGTNDRYSAGTRANLFKGDQRVSVFTNSSNTNQVGFTAAEGPAMRGGANSGGLATTSAAGINYNDVWSPAFEMSGNYNFNHTNSSNLRNSYRQNFFPTGTINDVRQSLSQYQSDVHRSALRITYTINERNSITYAPSVSYQHTESNNTDSATSFAVQDSLPARINQSNTHLLYKNHAVNWSNNLIWRRSFAKAGRTFSATFSNAYARNNMNGFNQAALTDYDRNSGAKVHDSLLNQQSQRSTGTDNINLSLSYTEPLGADKIWEINYNYTNGRNTSDRYVYDRNDITNKYDLLNDTLTNIFENKTETNQLGTNVRVTHGKFSYQTGIGYAISSLASNDISKRNLIKQRYGNLFPAASFAYQFTRSKSLRFNYRGATAQPSVLQLQPTADVSNPRYIREGNPALRQEFRNNVALTYNVFNATTLRNFFAAATFNNTYHKIAYSTELIDSFGSQRTKPVNLNGSYSLNGNFNVGVPINRMQGGNFNMTTTVAYNRDPNLLNGVTTFSKNLMLGEDLRLNYNFKEKLDLSINAGINYTAATYTVQQRRDAYYTHTYGMDANYLFGNGFILSSDFDLLAYTGRSDGFNQSYAIWNAAFARQFFKDNRGELRASVFDLLNNNRNLVRNVGETYIEDVQTNVLKRFFMLSFTYKFNQMGGRQMKRQAKTTTLQLPAAK